MYEFVSTNIDPGRPKEISLKMHRHSMQDQDLTLFAESATADNYRELVYSHHVLEMGASRSFPSSAYLILMRAPLIRDN